MFPLSGQGWALKIATRIDPLSYGIDGMRSMLLGSSTFSPITDIVVLACAGAVLLVVGAYRFSRIEI
jgi:ABC-2 type transport system permease protein